VSGFVTSTMVALALGVVVVRRRSIAVALVTAQALLVALAASREGSSAADAVAAGALLLRAVVLAAFFWLLVSRTREARPVRAGVAPLARASASVGLALALIWLMPPFGLDAAQSERAVLSIVAIGLVTVATRNATLPELGRRRGVARGHLQLAAGRAVRVDAIRRTRRGLCRTIGFRRFTGGVEVHRNLADAIGLHYFPHGPNASRPEKLTGLA